VILFNKGIQQCD